MNGGDDDGYGLFREVIAGGGFAVDLVRPAPGSAVPPYAYTVGLTARGHPELVVAGCLADDLMTGILTGLAGLVLAGRRLRPGDRAGGIIRGLDLAILGPADDGQCPVTAVGDLYPQAGPPYQVVLPDLAGLFPWERGYNMDLNRVLRQPLLGTPPGLADRLGAAADAAVREARFFDQFTARSEPAEGDRAFWVQAAGGKVKGPYGAREAVELMQAAAGPCALLAGRPGALETVADRDGLMRFTVTALGHDGVGYHSAQVGGGLGWSAAVAAARRVSRRGRVYMAIVRGEAGSPGLAFVAGTAAPVDGLPRPGDREPCTRLELQREAAAARPRAPRPPGTRRAGTPGKRPPAR